MAQVPQQLTQPGSAMVPPAGGFVMPGFPPAPTQQAWQAPPAPSQQGKPCACDACEKEILDTDPVCRHCGHVYFAQQPAAAPLLKRGQVQAVAAAPVQPAPAQPAAQAQGTPMGLDEIPF